MVIFHSLVIILSATNWDDEEINKRADFLFQDAKTLWQYPKELDLKLEFKDTDKEFYTLDDDIDITGKKPLYFEIFNEKYNTKSWNDLYIQLIKLLINFDEKIAQLLLKDDDFSGKNRKIFSSTKDNEKGKQVEIKENYFVETNLSANAIMSYIKLICEKFGLSGDDFIYTIRN